MKSVKLEVTELRRIPSVRWISVVQRIGPKFVENFSSSALYHCHSLQSKFAYNSQ